MTDWPTTQVAPLWLSSFHLQTGMWDVRVTASVSGVASIAWPAANQAVYLPFSLAYPYPVRRVFWGNGSALGNMDFGIYTSDGVRMYSTGSVAQSGGSAIQYVTPTEFLLAPGEYYLALANDGTTNRAFGMALPAAEMGRVIGYLQQVTAFALPATATFAQWASSITPICGITQTLS